MPACRYMDENGSAAMLATKRLVGVTPEVNFRECLTCMPLPSANNALWLWNPEEISPEVQNRDISCPTKRTYVHEKISKKRILIISCPLFLIPSKGLIHSYKEQWIILSMQSIWLWQLKICWHFYHPQMKFGARWCFYTCLSFLPWGKDVTSCLAAWSLCSFQGSLSMVPYFFWGLCSGGLCPGASVKGSLSRGSCERGSLKGVSLKGVSVKGVCLGVLWKGSLKGLSEGVSVVFCYGLLVESDLLVWPSGVAFWCGLLLCLSVWPSVMAFYWKWPLVWPDVAFCYAFQCGLLLWPSIESGLLVWSSGVVLSGMAFCYGILVEMGLCQERYPQYSGKVDSMHCSCLLFSLPMDFWDVCLSPCRKFRKFELIRGDQTVMTRIIFWSTHK